MGPKVANLSGYIVLKSVKPSQGAALDGLLETAPRQVQGGPPCPRLALPAPA